jgi:hypothetical protein
MQFLLGFIAASILWLALGLLIYLRARRRVQSVKAAIHRYKQAQHVVGQAVNDVYKKI